MRRFGLICGFVVIISTVAAAQDANWDPAATGPVYGPSDDASADAEDVQPAQGNYTYEGYLALGHREYMTQKYKAALRHYQTAKEMDPGRGDAYFFIGYTKAKQKHYSDAITVLKTAATIAGDADKNLHAKCLYNVGRYYEKAKEPAQAKFAYKAYIDYVSANSEVTGFAEYARERIEVIEKNELLKREYDTVRQRIEENTAK